MTLKELFETENLVLTEDHWLLTGVERAENSEFYKALVSLPPDSYDFMEEGDTVVFKNFSKAVSLGDDLYLAKSEDIVGFVDTEFYSAQLPSIDFSSSEEDEESDGTEQK